MTRKHFVELARILKNMKPTDCVMTNDELARDEAKRELWENMCNQMADFCHTFNNNFNRQRFLSACGVDG